MTKQPAPQRYEITEDQVETIHHMLHQPDHSLDEEDYVAREAILARADGLEEMGLNCFGEYQMNNRRCVICQVGERCYDKRESLRQPRENTGSTGDDE